MLSEVIAQTDRSARLLEKAQNAVAKVRGLRSGDRVYSPLVSFAEFQQGSAPSANLIFNVPADTDFWAYRILFYPYCRVIDPVNGSPDEITYRSTSFSGESFSTGFIDPATGYSDVATTVDATFAMIYQGKELQNIDIPISAVYCVNTLKWLSLGTSDFSGGCWSAASQTPGGMLFDIPMFLPRSKSLTVRVTPTYLGIRTIPEVFIKDEIVRQHQYKIVGVLEGEKKVTAFL